MQPVQTRKWLVWTHVCEIADMNSLGSLSGYENFLFEHAYKPGLLEVPTVGRLDTATDMRFLPNLSGHQMGLPGHVPKGELTN